jgi:large subunit ribosomal protein L9
MDIILKEDVQNLGHKDDIVSVKDGYARNYLIPKGLAVLASTSARKAHEEILRQRAHKLEKIKEQAEEMAKSLEGVKIELGAKTSSKGKIFGSVNNIQIAEALAAKGFDVDRKQISIDSDAIKEVGSYKAKIKLHRDVQVEIDVEIKGE